MQRLALSLALSSGCAAATPNFVLEGHGVPIYEGTVQTLDGVEVFEYTRTSRLLGSTLVSTHRSRDARTLEEVTVQSALHTRSYMLERAVEHHHQLGVESEVVVKGGDIVMRTRQNGQIRERVERLSAPPVVGPTLFGFTVTHLEALRQGVTLDVRFVVPERRRTYGFAIRLESQNDETITVVMEAQSPVIRWFVPPMRMVFNAQTKDIMHYQGRIPPRLSGRPVEAAVTYTMHGPFR